ncbi:MAG TPA: PRC-barrel domain-containing protein [Methylomusa anaerophila]|uniref:PRC-barrel domain protein n=1 Tax=Methylomusa anaerophila TaxID=1930071 RepID=A0A348AP90_9FIRM|nr:PRC-barrel domain-containing protein [Methylomusa anaerophila]BBB92888.1 PRC-barrel domain protein [Methylomusa anaerophila]HML87276.1 PRC-barrel domain-containing protein [Methylomusa anaerophila]
MPKLMDLLGLPVLVLETGIQIAEVQEILVELEQAVILGIMVTGSKWFTYDQGIMFEDLYRIGRDAILVRDSNVVGRLRCDSRPQVLHFPYDLCNKQIYTESGVQLGILVDIAFNETTGEITTYEVSDGLFSDLLFGRKLMPLPQAQVIGQDKLIVPETMAKLLHS